MIPDRTDQEVISDYIAGDEKAFAELVKRHMKSVYNLAYQLTHTVADAEDITQDTFLKVWKNIHRYDGRSNFKTWLLTIARNTTYDYLRKRKHVVFSAFENDNGENVLLAGLSDSEPLAFEMSVLKEDRKTITHALEKMKPIERELLALRFGEDLTFEEIAEIVRKPMNTVKSQVRRGLIKLKTIITKLEKDED